MSLITIRESETRSRFEWQAGLGISEAQFDYLCDRQIFDIRLDGLLTLNYVGFVVLQRHAVVSVPKYWDQPSSPVAFLHRVLATYFSRPGRAGVDSPLVELHYRDEGAVRELDSLYTLLRWFGDRGIYVRHERSSVLSGGRTDWGRTFVKTPPLFSCSSVIYPTPVLVSRSSLVNEVSALQLAMTIALLRKYEVSVPLAITSAAESLPLGQDPLGPKAPTYFRPLLTRERNSVYRTDDLALLMTLDALLGRQDGLGGEEGVTLYGTKAFYAVWEDGCRAWLKAARDDYAMAQPRWHLYLCGQWTRMRGIGEQRPDVVLQGESEIAVIDAKYYFPFPAARPGWQDIVKQLYYAESIVVAPGLSIGNVFLMPSPKVDWFQFAGIVEVSGGPRSFPPVEVWLANPELVFASYGVATDVEIRTVCNRFFAARDSMREMLGNTNRNVGAERGDGFP